MMQCNTMTFIFKCSLSVQKCPNTFWSHCMYDLFGQNRTVKVTPEVFTINPNSTQVIN